MGRHRFYAPPDSIGGSSAILNGEEAYHVTRVLRLRPGDEVYLFDGCGLEYRCRIQRLQKEGIEMEVIERLAGKPESPLRLTLAQSLLKGEKFDWVIQKATELGVSRIVPLATDHADVRIGSDPVSRRLDRWRRISLEALKQCGRRKLVEIVPPVSLGELLDEESGEKGAKLAFTESGGMPMSDAIEALAAARDVMAIIGPEGGWSVAELALFELKGVKSLTLGPRVLRSETAAIVTLALIQHIAGDLAAAGSEVQ